MRKKLRRWFLLYHRRYLEKQITRSFSWELSEKLDCIEKLLGD